MTTKMAWALLVFLLTAAGSIAQSRLTEEQKKEWKDKQAAYKAQLKLSADQEARVEQLNTSYLEGLSSLKQSGGSKLSRYKQFKRLNSERDAGMKKVLNPEQYKLYQQHQKELKDDMRKNRDR